MKATAKKSLRSFDIAARDITNAGEKRYIGRRSLVILEDGVGEMPISEHLAQGRHLRIGN